MVLYGSFVYTAACDCVWLLLNVCVWFVRGVLCDAVGVCCCAIVLCLFVCLSCWLMCDLSLNVLV